MLLPKDVTLCFYFSEYIFIQDTPGIKYMFIQKTEEYIYLNDIYIYIYCIYIYIYILKSL